MGVKIWDSLSEAVKNKYKNCHTKFYYQRFLTALNLCYYKRKSYIVRPKKGTFTTELYNFNYKFNK